MRYVIVRRIVSIDFVYFMDFFRIAHVPHIFLLDSELSFSDLTVQQIFSTRADLHRTVYMHAKVKAAELMVVDALTKANDFLGLASSVQEPEKFWKVILNIYYQSLF